jgi:hypothetical protein
MAIIKLNFLQQGGSIDINPQSFMPPPNDIKTTYEQFKTGVPTF